MGNTDGLDFAAWLRNTIAAKGWSIADLSREIARREGIDERDEDDFKRRSKAVHGYVSNMMNGDANWSDEYLKKIADALGSDQASMLKAAGRLRDFSDEGNVDTVTRGKLDTLLGLLDEDERVDAIQHLTIYIQTKNQQKAQRAKTASRPKRA